MISEKRTLPIGVEYGGMLHKELEIRSRRVGDLVNANESKRAQESDSYYNLCCLAGQVLKLGEIPRAAITADLLMEMESVDFDVFSEAAEVVRQRAENFREEA